MIASFTMYFTALDSFQALFFMDSVNVDHYLSKLPIVQSNQTLPNITSPTGMSVYCCEVCISIHSLFTTHAFFVRNLA